MQKMNLKDKAFLEKFRVKESSILIGLENFEVTVPIIGWLGWYSPHQLTNDQISTYQSPPNQISTSSP